VDSKEIVEEAVPSSIHVPVAVMSMLAGPPDPGLDKVIALPVLFFNSAYVVPETYFEGARRYARAEIVNGADATVGTPPTV
jgi:hypothetical protein